MGDSTPCKKQGADDGDDLLYIVKHSEELGRYLVAARDIESREVIIQETPFISGPSDESGDIPLCLGCCTKMTENEFARCSKCRWPICGLACEQMPCHAENECQVFRHNRVYFPPPHRWPVMNKSVLILRCLLLKDQNPSAWTQLMTMEDHSELRRNKPNCNLADQRIMDNFHKYYEAAKDSQIPFTEEEIRSVSGIIDVNAHTLPQKMNGKVVASACYIYMKTSLLAHNCVPNASWTTGLSGSLSVLTIRANIPIPKGDIISVAYDDNELMYGTLRRLIPMEISGLFVCRCQRCLDTTELGTNFSAVKCLSCPDGYLFSLNPVDSFADWKCNTCDNVQSDLDMMEVIDEAEQEAEFPKEDALFVADDDLYTLFEFVDNYSGKILHPNHYILQETSLRIVTCQSVCLPELTTNELNGFISRCEKLVAIADVLSPGICEYRAFVLCHLCNGLLERSQRTCKVDAPADVKELHKIHKLQMEALVFLQETYPSHKWVTSLKENTDKVFEQLCLVTKHDVNSNNGDESSIHEPQKSQNSH